MNKTNKPYTPTFTETKPRSFLQRMTPLAWLITAMAVLVVLGLGTVVVGNLTRQAASQRPLTEYVPTATSAAAAAPVTSAPTKPASAASVASTATPVATTQPTGLPATATAAPTTFVAPWAGKMVKQTDGTYMAPQEVVDAIKKMFKDWDGETAAANALPITQTIEQSKAIDDKFYWPDERDKTLTSLQQNGYYKQTAGTTQVTDVKNFSADGLSAQISKVSRGMIYDHYNLVTMKLDQQGIKDTDHVTIFNVRYNPDRKQWQIWNVDRFTDLPKQ